MAGSVKRCLRKASGNSRLSKDELLTVLVEIEGTLNSRPLTYEYNEAETETLTPSHLIFGRRIKSLQMCQWRKRQRMRLVVVEDLGI